MVKYEIFEVLLDRVCLVNLNGVELRAGFSALSKTASSALVGVKACVFIPTPLGINWLLVQSGWGNLVTSADTGCVVSRLCVLLLSF